MFNKLKLFLFMIIPVLMNCSRETPAQDALKISTKDKHEIIHTVAGYMDSHYVFPERGKEMADHIISNLSRGDYENDTEINDFCRRVTNDLRDVSQDKHIYVFESPDEAREVAARKGILSIAEIEEINQALFKREREDNFGFTSVQTLEGNIGYLRMDYFSGADTAKEILSSSMRTLSNSKALIIDLRNNGGGDGSLIPLFASYFFEDEIRPLTGTYLRSTDNTEASWTLPTISGKRMPEIDLYILTSSRTFSAAEDFSYSLKHLDRATIIGETTKGGAHPVDVFIVKGSVLTQISVGNSVNPITKSNWEGVGVKPDVEIVEEKALSMAQKIALTSLLKRTRDDDQRQKYLKLLKSIELSG